MVRVFRFRLATLIVVALSIAICSCGQFQPSLPPKLSKADATKILAFMGYQDIVVATVVDGVGALGMSALSSPNVALVIAIGTKVPAGTQEVRETFFYDKDLGWIYIELDTHGRRVRLWTRTGYKELKPPVTRD